MVVRLDETAAVRNNQETSRPASPFIAVVRPDGFARTYDRGLDSPVFLDTGDPTLSRPVLRLRRCPQVLDFASDIDPGGISRRGRLFRHLMSDRALSRCLASCCLRRFVMLTSSPESVSPATDIPQFHAENRSCVAHRYGRGEQRVCKSQR